MAKSAKDAARRTKEPVGGVSRCLSLKGAGLIMENFRMRNLLIGGAVAIAAAITSISIQTPAFAQGIELRIGPDGARIQERDRDRDRDRDRYRDRDRDDYRDRDRRGSRAMRGCSSDEARAIARHEGLRNARVVETTPRRVVVSGRTRDGRDRIIFANRSGCPIIG